MGEGFPSDNKYKARADYERRTYGRVLSAREYAWRLDRVAEDLRLTYGYSGEELAQVLKDDCETLVAKLVEELGGTSGGRV
jgi:hypothetical protein